MYYLFCKKIIQRLTIVGVLCLAMITAQAQRANDNRNYRDFQKKDYYFGMNFGLNFSSFHIRQSKFFIGNDSISITEGGQNPGFDIHMVTNLKMGDYFDFRFTPGFSFANRKFIFNGVKEEKVESVFLEVPILLRYKSAPYHDRRFFVTGGIKYSYDVASNSKSRKAATLIRIAPNDFQWEVGFGMQVHYPFFIFSPEIKFSRGISNTVIYNGDLNEARVLENVTSQVFTIGLNFEG